MEPYQVEAFIPQHHDQRDHVNLSIHSMGAQRNATVLKWFQGVLTNQFDPADPIIAAGPSHVIAAVNTVFGIYTKDGRNVFQTTFKNWFASLPDSASCALFDPKVIYDQYNRHFIMINIAHRQSDNRSWILLSVSKTSDPTGEWAFYELDMQLNNSQHVNGLFADFPSIGYDQSAVYLTSNMRNASDRSIAYGKIRVLSKNQLYSFAPLTFRDFWNLKDASGVPAINLQAAQSFGPTAVEYLINTEAYKGNYLTLWRIATPTTSPTLTKQAVTVSSYHAPPDAQQKGGGALINTGDAGVLNVVYSKGFIYTAHSISANWGSGRISAIRFYQISSNGIVNQEITYGSDGLNYFFPAVTPDSKGNVYLVFNPCGISEFAGAFFTSRMAADPSGTLRNSVSLKHGLQNYQAETLLNLWGDFSGIALDSSDSVWIFSEYALTRYRWATRVAQISYQ